MAEGDEYLDYLDETLEWVVKPWSTLLGVFLEMKWRVWTHHTDGSSRLSRLQTPGCQQLGKYLSATKNAPMNTTGTLWLCTEMEIQTTFSFG